MNNDFSTVVKNIRDSPWDRPKSIPYFASFSKPSLCTCVYFLRYWIASTWLAICSSNSRCCCTLTGSAPTRYSPVGFRTHWIPSLSTLFSSCNHQHVTVFRVWSEESACFCAPGPAARVPARFVASANPGARRFDGWARLWKAATLPGTSLQADADERFSGSVGSS